MNEKILIVDDEKDVADVLKEICELEGYTTDYAKTGEEGLSKLEKDPDIKVVLLDKNLPGISGLEFIKRAKNHLKHYAQIVLITGYPSAEAFREAIKSGAYTCMAKPFNIDEVIRIVRDAIKHYERAKQLKQAVARDESQALKESLDRLKKV
ncbi:MAG: response regulator [Candidatus Calescibacterium sp.]|nr:response regulator [Candidatus Calescibacterium sp.]MCX7734654.1 response regulator [bacterium]